MSKELQKTKLPTLVLMQGLPLLHIERRRRDIGKARQKQSLHFWNFIVDILSTILHYTDSYSYLLCIIFTCLCYNKGIIYSFVLLAYWLLLKPHGHSLALRIAFTMKEFIEHDQQYPWYPAMLDIKQEDTQPCF